VEYQFLLRRAWSNAGAYTVRRRQSGVFRSYAVVIIGSLILDLFEHSGNGGGQFDPTSTGLDHLALVTQASEDLQRWTRWLDLQKVQHSEIRTAQGMGSMFDFADPDGIQWEFLYLDPEKLQQLESYAQDSN